jgi:hypothetical protein
MGKTPIIFSSRQNLRPESTQATMRWCFGCARIQDLEPGTTYYYLVSSEQANGISDPGTSGVNQFMTRRADWISAKK